VMKAVMHHRHELELHLFRHVEPMKVDSISCFRPRSNFLVSLTRRVAALKRRVKYTNRTSYVMTYLQCHSRSLILFP